jgi:queuine/archaeosine tRNA-ribosyltransferase
MPDDVRATGAEIVLGNTYHLMLRPVPNASPRSAGCTNS